MKIFTKESAAFIVLAFIIWTILEIIYDLITGGDPCRDGICKVCCRLSGKRDCIRYSLAVIPSLEREKEKVS